jgi:hypothetical protein
MAAPPDPNCGIRPGPPAQTGALWPQNRTVEGPKPSSGSTSPQLSRLTGWLSCLLCFPSRWAPADFPGCPRRSWQEYLRRRGVTRSRSTTLYLAGSCCLALSQLFARFGLAFPHLRPAPVEHGPPTVVAPIGSASPISTHLARRPEAGARGMRIRSASLRAPARGRSVQDWSPSGAAAGDDDVCLEAGRSAGGRSPWLSWYWRSWLA